nr:hypothetical protein [Paraflavitalea speifideiaquila]
MAALLFGAALTTFNAGLNSSGTLFTLNIYKPLAIKRNGNQVSCIICGRPNVLSLSFA